MTPLYYQDRGPYNEDTSLDEVIGCSTVLLPYKELLMIVIRSMNTC